MSKEIAEDFLFVETARDLWKELQQRFGESNTPLLYQLKRNISLMMQGDLTVMQYFTKLKRLWSEMALLRPDPVCSCNCSCKAFTKIAEYREEDKLIQFLLGLNDVYESVISQILLMEPLPSINRAYAMIIRIEKQREVAIDNSVEIANFSRTRSERGGQFRREGKEMKFQAPQQASIDEERPCSNCGNYYHSRSTCFKMIGEPDWYKQLKKKRQNRVQAHNAAAIRNSSSDSGESVEEIKQSQKLLARTQNKGKAKMNTPVDEGDFTAFAGAAGFNAYIQDDSDPDSS